MDKLILGYHVRKSADDYPHEGAPSLATACEYATGVITGRGFTPCVQFFVCNPQSHVLVDISPDEHARLLAIPNKVIHGSYVSNPWGRAKGSVHNLKRELKIARGLNAHGVIVHLGAGANDPATLKYVLGHCMEPIAGSPCKLILEVNSQRASKDTFETPEKINRVFREIYHTIPAVCHKNIGLCVDTAHVFACGVSMGGYQETAEWLAKLDENIPVMFHLNDTSGELGDGKDIHEELFTGNIWRDYGRMGSKPTSQSGVMAILDYAKNKSSMVILERPRAPLGELMMISELMR